MIDDFAFLLSVSVSFRPAMHNVLTSQVAVLAHIVVIFVLTYALLYLVSNQFEHIYL